MKFKIPKKRYHDWFANRGHHRQSNYTIS